MLLQELITVLITLTIAEEILGNPLKFPEETNVGQPKGANSGEDIEARFHHHRKKKKKKPGCGLHNRFKRADQQGRFFFPILNYYDTNVYVNNNEYGHGEGSDSGCGSGMDGGGSVLPALGVGSVLPGLGGGLGSIGSGLGGGIGNLGSGLGSGLGTLGSGISSNLPSIGSGIPSYPSLGGSRPPSSPQSTRPPPILPPLVTNRPPSPVSTLDPDNEDYDYSDFSTTTRTRPTNSLADYPVINSISNSIRPVFERPQRVFNQYVVRPINRTIREFYSLF